MDKKKGTKATKAKPAVEKQPVKQQVVYETVTMVATPRIGTHVCRGPVTGNYYEITRFGTPGIDIRDAEIISKTPVPFMCARAGGWIEILPAGIAR